MKLNWKPITEVGDEVRPLFLFTPDTNAATNVKRGLVWVSGGRREHGGCDYGKENPTYFAEIEGPFD